MGISDSEFNVKLTELKQRSRLHRVMFLWRKAYKRAKGGAQLIHVFYHIHKKIILYGSTKNLYGEKKFRGQELGRRRKCLLMPESLFISIWTIIITILLVYTAIFVPYRLAFLTEDTTAL